MTKLKSPIALWSLLLGGIILMVGLIWTQPANAQCGSSASSCKNCHEVQGEYPVNNDGTSWHEAHAFGDFCEFCHAGNVQATDEAAAHSGMEAPMDNVQASCGNCHAADLNDRALVYAGALGIEIGSGDSGDSGGSDGGDSSSGSGGSALTADVPISDNSGGSDSSSAGVTVSNTTAPVAPSGIIVDDPNVIDYVARYNEVVLGLQPINWGNRLLAGLIMITLIAGGGFILWNERRLRRRQIPISAAVVDEQKNNYPNYAPEVIALLPRIANLSPQAQNDLYQFLGNPANAQILLRDMLRLEPELVNQLRGLDKESQVLLFALAGSGD